MTKNNSWSFKKKILITIMILWLIFVTFILLGIGSVSDFKAHTRLDTEEFNYREVSEQANNLLQDCYGFEGICDLDALGVRLELVFHGIALNIPSPKFLNMSGWGDHSGWRLEKAYFGTREFKIINTDKQEMASFTQSYWNNSAYVSFDRLVAIDSRSSRIYISSKPFGFSSINERGWAVHF